MKNTQTQEAPKVEKPRDLLAFSRPIWNGSQGQQVDGSIDLRDPKQNVLASYDYEATPLTLDGKPTRFSMLRTTDEGLPVGIPFDPKTYKVLFNNAFIAVVESLCEALSKLGIKHKIATTGTLRHRGRLFIAVEIDDMSEFNIGGRQFFAFLNCLNSVDKSCSVTFANNTFCVCCKNSFSCALRAEEGSEFHAKIKHTDGMTAALADVPQLIDLWATGNERIFSKLESFNSIGVTSEQAENAFAAFLTGQDTGSILKTRSLNIVDKIKGLFVRGAGNKGETMLDLFSAATEYYSHESAGNTEDPWKQIETSEIGDGAKRKGQFFDLLCGMADTTGQFNGIVKVGNHILIASRKAAKEAKEAKAK
jgi:hypothetical protein